MERERERERETDKSTFLQPSKDGTMEFIDFQEKDGGKEDSVIQEILEELSFVTQEPEIETSGLKGKEIEKEDDFNEENEGDEDDNKEKEPFLSYLSSILFSSNQLKMSFFCAFACLCALYITIPVQIQPYLNRLPDQITRSGIAWIIFFIVSHLL